MKKLVFSVLIGTVLTGLILGTMLGIAYLLTSLGPVIALIGLVGILVIFLSYLTYAALS